MIFCTMRRSLLLMIVVSGITIHADIEQLSENLFYTKKNGYFIVMERIDKQSKNHNFDFWRNLINKQEDWHNTYRGMTVKNKWGGGFWSSGRTFLDGALGFQESLKFTDHNELWVAYVSRKKPDPFQKNNGLSPDDIEMFVSVMTTKNAPMVTHMGITRNFGHLIQNANNPQQFPRHKNLSLQLHSFAASVMKKRHQKLRYMITSPTPSMAKILKKNFKEGIFFGEFFSTWKKSMRKNELQQALSEKEPKLRELYQKKEPLEKKITELDKISEIIKQERKKVRNSPKAADKLKAQKLYGDLEKIENIQDKTEDKIWKLDKTISRLENKELDALAMDLQPIKNEPPIGKTSYRTQIFDKDRKTIIYDANKRTKIISVFGKKLDRNQYETYNWFNHHLSVGGSDPFATIEIDVLAQSYFE